MTRCRGALLVDREGATWGTRTSRCRRRRRRRGPRGREARRRRRCCPPGRRRCRPGRSGRSTRRSRSPRPRSPRPRHRPKASRAPVRHRLGSVTAGSVRVTFPVLVTRRCSRSGHRGWPRGPAGDGGVELALLVDRRVRPGDEDRLVSVSRRRRCRWFPRAAEARAVPVLSTWPASMSAWSIR